MKCPLTVILINLFFWIFTAGELFCQVDLKKGLTAYLQFDGSMYDSSVNSYTGFFSGGVSFGPDRFGKEKSAIVFDGTSGYASISVNEKLYQSSFTVSGWFKSSGDKEQNILGKMSRLTSSINEEFQVFLNKPNETGLGYTIVPEGTDCTLGRKSAESLVFVSKPYCKERWYFFLVTFDGKFQKIYIDGKLSASKSVNFSRSVSCSQNILFGAGNQSKPDYLQGSLDEIRFYDRVMNEEEIEALFGFNNNPLYDFSYLPNSCNPLEVKFIYNGPGDRVKWLIENQSEKQGRIINNLFASSNDYKVGLIVEYNNCPLKDTLNKNVALKFKSENLILNSDTSICAGTTLQMNNSIESGF
nr:LamG domain-containing protein [Chitinophagaceae bacterium]